jgi:DNA-binding LacI/PurR family transcriptional regulator
MLPCPVEEDRHEYLKRMVARRLVDAMILSATQRVDQRIDFLVKARLPFVTLGRSSSGGAYSWIDLDFEGVARSAVNRLVAHGHQRIAVAVPANDINLGHIFLGGYRSALQEHGIDYDPALVMRAKSSEQGGYHAAETLLRLEPRPTAVILIYELMAIGLYRRLMEAGIIPGKDIAVIGFREEPRARFLQPTLTCFRMSLRDLGVELGEMLLSTIPAYQSFYPDKKPRIVWPMELVAGESDAFFIEPVE